MRFNKPLTFLLIISLFGGIKFVYSQDEGIANEEMKKEQWETQINEYTAKKTDLTAKIVELQKDRTDLQAKFDAKKGEVKRAEDNYWNGIGGKDAYNSYKVNLDKVEKLCKSREGNKADIEIMFGDLSKSGLKCHPDFATKYRTIKECLSSWQQVSVTEYTVLKGDYLFMIAAKKEVYNNHHLWPILWEANENGVLSAPGRIPKTIKNPNLIYPGQVLKIPQLNQSNMKSSIFDRAKTWLDWKKTKHIKRIKKQSTEVKKEDVKK
jgi:nucleoid-associated protein YgaU